MCCRRLAGNPAGLVLKSRLQLYLSAKSVSNWGVKPGLWWKRERQYLEWTTWLESSLAAPPFHSANSVSQDAEDILISRLTEDELLFVEYFGLHSRFTVLSQRWVALTTILITWFSYCTDLHIYIGDNLNNGFYVHKRKRYKDVLQFSLFLSVTPRQDASSKRKW